MITIFSCTNRQNSYTHRVADIYSSIFKNNNIKSQIFDFQELPDDFIFSNSSTVNPGIYLEKK